MLQGDQVLSKDTRICGRPCFNHVFIRLGLHTTLARICHACSDLVYTSISSQNSTLLARAMIAHPTDQLGICLRPDQCAIHLEVLQLLSMTLSEQMQEPSTLQ